MARNFLAEIDSSYPIPGSICVMSGSDSLDIRDWCDTVADFETAATGGFELRRDGLITYEKSTQKLKLCKSSGDTFTWVEIGKGTEVVNDLTTGGTDKALSAEQGKTIKSQLDEIKGDTTAKELLNVTVTENYTSILPIDYLDNILYGVKDLTKEVYKSHDEGESWEMCFITPITIHRILKCLDGEVLCCGNTGIIKSKGWDTENINWSSNKVIKTPGLGILPWGIDGDGTKFIATEYSGVDRSESRYIWISVDAGETFSIVLDKYSIDPDNTSHMHGVCYDKWADRFFVSHGHGIIRGVYWSDDNGVSWNKIGGEFQPDASPTTLIATINGIVCGSDSGAGGLYGIERTLNPEDMEMKRTARWYTDREGVSGFAFRSILDDDGQVYVSFKSDFETVSSVIMCGTATTGNTIWTSINESNAFLNFAVTKNKVLGVITKGSTKKLIKGIKSKLKICKSFDNNNIESANVTSTTSIGIGYGVNINTPYEVAIGNRAKVGSNLGDVAIGNMSEATISGVAIGNQAKSTGEKSTAIGSNTITSSAYSVCIGTCVEENKNAINAISIGRNSKSSPSGVAIGSNANSGTSSNIQGIAIGNNASCSSYGLAIGSSAKAGSSQVAIGQNATSNFTNGIALGSNTTTTSANQVQIGNRHIEMKVIDDPVNVPIDTGRVFVRKNASNKLEYCVRLGANTTVLATEI